MVTLSIAVTDWTTLGVAPGSGYLKFQLVSPVLNTGTGQIQSTAPWTIAVDATGAGSGPLPTVPTGNALIVTSRVDGFPGVWYVAPPLTDLNLADLLTNYQVDPTSLLPAAPPASWVTALNAEIARASAAEALKAPIASPAFTGTPTGITKAHVGLSNVDNTSDANKPVSTAQATSIAGKAPLVAARRQLTGMTICNGTYMWGNPTARTLTGSSRRGYRVLVDATDIQLTFGAWANNGTSVATNWLDVDGTTAATVSASIEMAGVIYRVTVNGAISWTISPGGIMQTDPLPIEVTAGTIIYIRTFINGSSWFATAYSSSSGGSGGWVVTTDLTAPGSGAIADSQPSYLFMPMAITGLPLTVGNTNPVVLIMGDSIGHGTADGGQTNMQTGINVNNAALGGGGFIQRALTALGVGAINAAVPGDRLSTFVLPSGRYRRMRFARDATTAISEGGRNDIGAGNGLSTIQANMIAAWLLVSRAGMRVIQTTITPQSTSTDGWLTVANQTGVGSDSIRPVLNDWIRAGAPMIAGAAVAVGTGGALLAGQAGHPLYSYFEIADLVESSRASNKFKDADNVRVVTDAAMTAAAYVLTSATAAFTTADIGRIVSLAGAGTAGATLYAGISGINSATSANLFSPAVTTVSGATLTLADKYTADGLHPTSYGAQAASAGIIGAYII